jgi:hypothetical protein
MASRSGSSSSRRLALAALLALALGAGCGDSAGPELTFRVTGASTCAITCAVTGVDIYVLQARGASWCVLAARSFVPTGERAIDGLDLEPGTSVRLLILGYCGQQCACRFDSRVVIDPAAGTIPLKLVRDSPCDRPTFGPCL